MKTPIILCDFKSEPSKTECYEAIWSMGASCKSCLKKCYRSGWSKQQVAADNIKNVAANRAARRHHKVDPLSPVQMKKSQLLRIAKR